MSYLTCTRTAPKSDDDQLGLNATTWANKAVVLRLQSNTKVIQSLQPISLSLTTDVEGKNSPQSYISASNTDVSQIPCQNPLFEQTHAFRRNQTNGNRRKQVTSIAVYTLEFLRRELWFSAVTLWRFWPEDYWSVWPADFLQQGSEQSLYLLVVILKKKGPLMLPPGFTAQLH